MRYLTLKSTIPAHVIILLKGLGIAEHKYNANAQSYTIEAGFARSKLIKIILQYKNVSMMLNASSLYI